MALWKIGYFELVHKISRKLFELGAWNLSADRVWRIDYQINFWTNSFIFSSPEPKAHKVSL